MKLIDAVQQIDALDANATLYVRHPWEPSSDTEIAVEGTDDEEKLRSDGLSYFLEVLIAKDFLIGWQQTQRRAPTVKQSCNRLIEYATNDP